MNYANDGQTVWAPWKGKWVKGTVIAAMGDTARVRSADTPRVRAFLAKPRSAWDRIEGIPPADPGFDTWFGVDELRAKAPGVG